MALGMMDAAQRWSGDASSPLGDVGARDITICWSCLLRHRTGVRGAAPSGSWGGDGRDAFQASVILCGDCDGFGSGMACGGEGKLGMTWKSSLPGEAIMARAYVIFMGGMFLFGAQNMPLLMKRWSGDASSPLGDVAARVFHTPVILPVAASHRGARRSPLRRFRLMSILCSC